MINETETLKLYGYTSDSLSKGSHKPIVCICDECGEVRINQKRAYRSICISCINSNGKHRMLGKTHNRGYKGTRHVSHGDKNPFYGKNKGEDNPMYGKHHSEKSKIQNSCSNQGITINDFNGFVHNLRPHLIPVKQCIHLNTRFPGSNAHHIMSGVVIFMPKNMHKSISHNFKTSKNMLEINRLAWDWLTQNF